MELHTALNLIENGTMDERKEAAKLLLPHVAIDALNIQSASNLSGVVHSFSKAMKVLSYHPDSEGTDWKNKHPVAVLFAVQIAYLTGVAVIADDSCGYTRCYKACELLRDMVAK